MKLKTALALAMKHGTVTKVSEREYEVRVNAKNVVTFEVGYVTVSAAVFSTLYGGLEPGVLNIAHSWLNEESRTWDTMGCRTLAGALSNAKWQQRVMTCCGREVSVTTAYDRTFKRSRLVRIDGVEVVNNRPEFDGLVDLAADAGECGPLLDWVEENHAAKSRTLILV